MIINFKESNCDNLTIVFSDEPINIDTLYKIKV